MFGKGPFYPVHLLYKKIKSIFDKRSLTRVGLTCFMIRFIKFYQLFVKFTTKNKAYFIFGNK